VNPKPKTLNQKSTDGLNNYLTGIVPGEKQIFQEERTKIQDF
jgi:hypothetical protein